MAERVAVRPRARSSAPSTRSQLVDVAAALLLLGWGLTCLIRVRAIGVGLLAALVVGLATLTPFLVLLVVPLVTRALRRRSWVSWVSCAICVVAAALPWFFVLGYAAPSDATPAEGSTTVRMLLVNAHQGRADARAIVAAAAQRQVELVVVTELSSGLAHDLTAAGLDGLVTPRWVQVPGQNDVVGPSDAGIGVWSHFPIDSVQLVPGTQWPAVIGRVDAPGAPFVLIAGHVEPPLSTTGTRWAQDLAAFRAVAEQVRTTLPGTPQVLLGNLNATPWHADYRRFAGVGLVDAAQVRGQGLRATWPTWSPLPILPLDHALVSRTVSVSRIDSVVIDGTDHRALMLTVALPPRP